MARIEISSITGASPFDVYVSDVYGNNQVFIATINTAVPPVEYFYYLHYMIMLPQLC